MSQPTGGYNPPHRHEDQSTPAAAKQEAAGVARTAAQRGGQVGDTAGEQAKRVASETARQARDLVEEGRGQLVEQAREGQRKAAGGLRTLADQLRDMSEKSDGEGIAPEVVRQAAERTHGVATWLDEREPGALLDEVRAFARRRPGMFLAGAAVAGVLAGRLTRGAVSAASDSDSGSPRRPAPVRYGDPAAVATPSRSPAPGYAPGSPPAPQTGRPVQTLAGHPGLSAPSPETTGEYPGQVTR